MKANSKVKMQKAKAQETKVKEKTEFYQAIGRRKEATARVKLFVVNSDDGITLKDKVLKKGEMLVNYRSIEQYFPGEVSKKLYLEPFRTTNTLGRFSVSALVKGGGLFGQLGAFIHGVTRALEKVDKEKFRPILKKRGFITRDPRTKERRKAGLAQKARAKKQSPKR